jgi:hypothetical protein
MTGTPKTLKTLQRSRTSQIPQIPQTLRYNLGQEVQGKRLVVVEVRGQSYQYFVEKRQVERGSNGNTALRLQSLMPASLKRQLRKKK